MVKKGNRPFSRYTEEALKLLAGSIKAARLERGITAHELAQRAAISRDLLYRIEQADPACGIGVVFETARVLGLSLFQANDDDLIAKNKVTNEKLALLPRRARPAKFDIDDDF